MGKVSLLSVCFFLLLIHSIGSAQSFDHLRIAMQFLSGEYTLEVSRAQHRFGQFNYHFMLFYTDKALCVENANHTSKIMNTRLYNAPFEVRIVSARFKADDGRRIIAILSNGTVLLFTFDDQQRSYIRTTITPSMNLANAQKIIGDAVYVLKQGSVYASWDTAKTWMLDTTGMGNEYVQDVTVDTNYYGWAVTQSRNLYRQHKDSSVWRKNDAFTTTGFPQAVFVDRRGRMFISTNTSASRVWMSTDAGANWVNTSAGITETISSFGDDIFGNVYAVGTGSQAYRLSDLTLPWIPIADSINATAYLPSNTKLINSISGDSTITAATRYGVFRSSDLGATWKPAVPSEQIAPHNLSAAPIRAGNCYFVSTSLGVFRIADGDSVWKKVLPKTGFISGVNAIYADSAGTLVANFPIKTGPSSSLFLITRSTDLGETWLTDTAGFKAMGINAGTQQYDLFVEKQGMLYLGGNGVLYSKKPGGIWKRDTAGLGIKFGEYVADVSLNNKKGITYAARRTGTFPTYTLAVYQRSNGDSVWNTVNTASLATSEGRLVSDHEGNIVLRTLSGSYKFWKYDGAQWTEIPLPTGLGSSPFAQMHTVDRSGVLWASFFGGGINQGIYFRTNGGTQWKHAGLKGVGTKFLSTVGDTAYAVTFIDGVHGFTTASIPASVRPTSSLPPSHAELYQNFPNPFNPVTQIRFTLPASGFTSLKVYDVLGRETATLVNEPRDAGSYDVQFNGKDLSSGVYFYRLQAGNFTVTRKLLLQK